MTGGTNFGLGVPSSALTFLLGGFCGASASLDDDSLSTARLELFLALLGGGVGRAFFFGGGLRSGSDSSSDSLSTTRVALALDLPLPLLFDLGPSSSDEDDCSSRTVGGLGLDGGLDVEALGLLVEGVERWRRQRDRMDKDVAGAFAAMRQRTSLAS